MLIPYILEFRSDFPWCASTSAMVSQTPIMRYDFDGVLWLPFSGSQQAPGTHHETSNPPIYGGTDGVQEGVKNRKFPVYIVAVPDGSHLLSRIGSHFGDGHLGAALRGAFDAWSKRSRGSKLSGHVRSLSNSTIYVHFRLPLYTIIPRSNRDVIAWMFAESNA